MGYLYENKVSKLLSTRHLTRSKNRENIKLNNIRALKHQI